MLKYVFVFSLLASAAYAEDGVVISESAGSQKLYEAAMQARARAGLPKQVQNPQLAEDAQKWAEHLAATGQFYHAPGRMEIIAMQGGNAPEAAGVQLWMDSGAHRAIMLGGCQECGYGMATKNGRTLFCGVFSKSSHNHPALYAATHPLQTAKKFVGRRLFRRR